ALVNLIPALEKATAAETGETKIGMQIVARALEVPLRRIAQNSGDEASVVVNTVKNSPAGIGYNARTGGFEDMIKAGVVDPSKVTRTALQNAASVVALLLTTDVLIADKPEEKAAAPAGAGMGGGMGGMDY
ncbi:molecular chaperone GroEL, partial [bacterium]|nr:molecular chaperone GroEL [bacterium]